MKHDELMTRINIVGDTSIEAALRAVVELHKPKYMGCGEGNCCGPDMCECGDTLPCPTIQAIERELS